jgi:hypothetical protein
MAYVCSTLEPAVRMAIFLMRKRDQLAGRRHSRAAASEQLRSTRVSDVL